MPEILPAASIADDPRLADYANLTDVALRRKLEPDPAHPIHLITEPGLGYRLDE